MSLNLKNKKTLVIAAIAVVAVIVLIAIFFPSGNKTTVSEEEVISKRVKISLQDEMKPAEALPEGAAPATPETPQDAQSAPVAITPTQPPVQAAAEKTALPAPVKVEVKPAAAPAPQPVKAVEKKEEPLKAVKAQAPAKMEPAKETKAAVKKETPQKNEEKADIEKAKEEIKAKLAAKTQKQLEKEKTIAAKPWAINVASFPSLREAQSLAAALKSAGYNTYITDVTKETVKWHRVRVGYFKTREEAEKAGKKIGKKFNVDTPWIVKPTKSEGASHAR
ncbi:MAG: SPOR domain-containing protein [Deltaproteobacteria bacterium]|nr:SPOR domain-containing protein [Deltaproteobacteria bacterium]